MATATKTGVTTYATPTDREVVVTGGGRAAALETGMKGGMDESFARLDRFVPTLA